ncbi:hypothetical protein [Bacteroides fragilis]|uniref:hypothetical protein n=1 Tax=Bacteroides fragilis TaxID=817 RepID=UPI0032DB1621
MHQIGKVFHIPRQCREQTERAEEVFVRAQRIFVGLEVADAPFVDKRHAVVVQVVHVFGKPDGFNIHWLFGIETARFRIDEHSFACRQLEIGFGISRSGQVVVNVASFGHSGEELAECRMVAFDTFKVFLHLFRSINPILFSS